MQSKAYKLRVCCSKKYLPGSGGPPFRASRTRTRSNRVNLRGSATGSDNHNNFSSYQCGIFLSLKFPPVQGSGIASNSNLQEYQKRIFSTMENQKNKEKEDSNHNDAVVLDDNPCWGSPTQHQLEDLLSILDRNTSIVYDSPQYLVLNKPPDLRMDGPYPATVHKLLTYWYPPPSLLSLGKCKPKLKAASTESETIAENEIDDNDSHHNTLLLQAVSRLHRHNDVHDNFLRPCHQLDYATSGILLVAKTQEAAAHIGRLFEERHEGVQKSYIAVVVGDLRKGIFCNSKENESDVSNTISPNVPIWTEGSTTRELREQLQRLEQTYRRWRFAAGKQHRRVRDASKSKTDPKKEKKPSFTGVTFEGFQPAHAIFAKWKSKQKRIIMADESSPPKKKTKKRKFKKPSASDLLTDDDWGRIWDPVNEVVGTTTTITAAAINFEKLEWKQLPKVYPALKQAIIRATDLHNDILRDAVRDNEQKKQEEVGKNINSDSANCRKELPTLFRLSENSETANNGDHNKRCVENSNNDDSTFYICCPLAQHPDQFNMVVPTSMARKYPHLPTPPGSNIDCNKDDDTINDKNSQLKFRPSLTKCTILERGTISIVRNDMETKVDVTKVRLYPMTGRRHQLRVHMSLTGFPILGDVAYDGDRYEGRKKDQSNDEREHEMGIDICSRMCLHAQSLQLPTLLGERERDWEISSSDPFVFESDSKLQLN